MTQPLRIYEYPDGNRALYLEGTLTDAIADTIVKRKINRLVVVSYQPWSTSRLSAVQAAIDELWLQSSDVPLRVTDGFSNLRSLHLDTAADGFDFSQFGKLRECGLANQREIPSGLKNCSQLASLAINQSSLKTLEPVVAIGSLQRLVLNSVSVPSLAPLREIEGLRHLGITRFLESDLGFLSNSNNLNTCYLLFGSKLSNLEGIEGAANLADLMLANCPKVTSLGPVARLRALQRLTLENCPSLDSIRPLTGIEKLNTLLLLENTRVGDGDIRCMLTLPELRELSFKSRKGYNLSVAEAKIRTGQSR